MNGKSAQSPVAAVEVGQGGSQPTVSWVRSEERRPKDGEKVLAYWFAIGFEPEMDVAEYHYREARQQLNSHIWHAPGNDEDDYREPEFWMPLPEAPQ